MGSEMCIRDRVVAVTVDVTTPLGTTAYTIPATTAATIIAVITTARGVEIPR